MSGDKIVSIHNIVGISFLERVLYHFRAPIFDKRYEIFKFLETFFPLSDCALTNSLLGSDWVEFTEFAPYYFREIRYSAGITDETYIEYEINRTLSPPDDDELTSVSTATSP